MLAVKHGGGSVLIQYGDGVLLWNLDSIYWCYLFCFEAEIRNSFSTSICTWAQAGAQLCCAKKTTKAQKYMME